MIDHTICPIRNSLSHRMVHKMSWELTCRPAAIFQPPHDTIGIAFPIDFHNANAVLRFQSHILQKLTASCGYEIFPFQIIRLNAKFYPRASLRFEIGTAFRHLLFLHAISQIPAVPLVPSLPYAVMTHADIFLHYFYAKDIIHL